MPFHFRKLKNGNYEIGVHIADVSHYVEPETPLDKAAYEKATSVYLPDRVNPMLPEHISNVFVRCGRMKINLPSPLFFK